MSDQSLNALQCPYRAIIGELDEELDEATDYDNMLVEPLDPIKL